MEIQNAIVLVTGGSRGIGKAIALTFADKGARIILVYRSNKEAALQTLQELPGKGHHIYPCDVTDADAVTGLFEYIDKSHGQLDVVVNNAGIGFHHPIDVTSFEDWRNAWQKILAANLIGPSNVAYHAAQRMIQQGGGKIINVTSRGAFRGEPDQPAYGASKAGLNSLTQSLAYKLSPYGIFVGAVAPGFVETDMAFERLKGESGKMIRSQSPMNRVARPSEVAQAVFLMAQCNQWMTGGIFDVNGASYFRT